MSFFGGPSTSLALRLCPSVHRRLASLALQSFHQQGFPLTHSSRRDVSRSSHGIPNRRKRIPGVPADRGGQTIDDLVQPRTVKPPRIEQPNACEEWSSGVDQVTIGLTLDEFFRRHEVRRAVQDYGIGERLFTPAFRSFKSYCTDPTAVIEPALTVTFSDIITSNHDVGKLIPFFIEHAKKVFPHLEAMDDLRIISDLTQPHNWYPDARTLQRKIIFHAGPTNSGKTYHALQRFREAKSGVYCGPLKLLAAEVFQRTNEEGIRCDMVTGEERRFAIDNLHPSPHISSTVEMLSTQMRVEVAVIDEIQMLRDDQRGWAWTRALLGVAADEVHVCGEPAAIDIVRKLLEPIGETVEVREYQRKTPLSISREGIRSLDKIEPGDCIVCFSRRVIFSVSKQLERLGIKAAVIYGDLPPGTKLAQAAKFNDPEDPCNVLVATDAIGMGLNLNIKRIIFASTTRQGELIPNYAALQIAGRAGRYGTQYSDGVATTWRQEDIGTLRDILAQPVLPIQSVGVAPTFEQIETFSFHLPQASFVHLLDLFVSVCSISDHFFICTVNQMRELAELIDKIVLPLKVRYTFCTCPLSVDTKMAGAAFVKMARRFSTGQLLTHDWLMDILDVSEWPPEPPTNLTELVHLERIYEIMDTYLWLSLRFPDMLPDEESVRVATRQIDEIIRDGVENIIHLFESEQREQGKEGSLSKKQREREQTAREEAECAALETVDVASGDAAALKMPDKRRGKRRSILDVVKGKLTPEELQRLRQALKDDDGL